MKGRRRIGLLSVAALLLTALCHNTIPVDQLAQNLSRLSVEELRDRIELYIDNRAGTEEIPGAAAAIFKEGTPILWVHKGLAEDQPVSIASLTKPFTAMVIIRLARSGKLDLDAPIQEFLPELKTPAGGSAEEKGNQNSAAEKNAPATLTARMLLSHTSGISYNAGKKEDTFLLEGKRFPLPQAKNRGKFEYSNFNYHILAILAHRLSGKPLARLTEDWILKPAGMRNTKAQGTSGAAGMVSTLEDLTRFCEFLLSENKQESSPYYRVFQAFQNLEHRKSSNEYGLGWHVYAPSNGQALFFHSGTWYNAAAEIYIMPESSSYFVHIANPPDFRDKATARYRSDVIKMATLALTRPD
ncbi:MAG: beta-lactamase family protein [Leptospiraceae bacterium]|nr:beta-lactamase family protein [Leptospiraceae bacterium]